MVRRTFFFILPAAICLALSGSPATAQSYPAKTIRIVVAGGPGGPNDIVARLAAGFLSKLGQAVVVENRPGAGGAVGARSVATALPDGHTLLVGNTAILAVLPAISASVGYDPINSFAPIAKFWESYQAIVVPTSLPAKTLQEFVDLARGKPGKLNYSHGTTGGLPHLAGELLKARAGIDLVGVSYRSEPEFVTAVMSETVHMAIPSIETALPLIREGKIRALGVTSETRTQLAPDLPTVMEAGVSDYEVATFFGIVAPAGTPDFIIQRLNAAINDGLNAAETKAIIANLGVLSRVGTAPDFAGFIANKRQKWMAVAKTTGVKID